ncbi:MAG TPA: GGDEF and EAL domain-containing protein [Rhizomicrobium sp.]
MAFALLFALAAAILTGLSQAGAANSRSVDFGGAAPVMDLTWALSPYHAANGTENDDSRWYMMTAANQSVRPATRVLLADQPFDSALRIFPQRGRAAIRQVATSDADVIVENAHAYGRYAFRVTIPPATSAELAVRLSNANAQPQLSAWLEPVLAAHNQQLAVLFAAVAGLIAAALAIMTGLAVMTGHAAPRWAAVVLLGVLLVRLAAAGLFDAVGIGGVGGPYGMTAMLSGLTLAGGIRLADTIAPARFDWGQRTVRWILSGLVALSAFAVVGVPGAMLLADCAVVTGAAAIAAYLVHQGLSGAQAARVAAPSAVVFALVTTTAAVSALGGFPSNTAAPGVIGGFAATGAVLLALAIAAGEGIAILPARRSTNPPPPPLPQLPQQDDGAQAIAAIGASYQGIFEFDLKRDRVRLSPEAAALLGLRNGAERFSNAEWLARLHPEDREVYRDAVERFGIEEGLAFRVEFRAQTEQGHYCWLELRASALGQGAGVERFLGLIADVTTRREADTPEHVRGERDALTGLRNRSGLVAQLEELGSDISSAILVLLDVDRFKSVHASLGDEGGDSVLVGIARRLATMGRGRAQLFRIGGDGFALLFVRANANALALGERIVNLLREPHVWEGRSAFAPASVGLALGRDAKGPFDLIKNSELALLKAKRDGGACARLYGRELENSGPPDAMALEAELRQSLAKGELKLSYQPIIRLANGAVAGFEALLRWNHPERGPIPPSDFITHAEETGLIADLGSFVLSCAAGDLGRWQKTYPAEPPLFVSVNVSRRQLKDRELEKFVLRTIANAGVKPGTLKLEVTESAVSGGHGVQDILAKLRGCGVSLAIDDFGTGQSTLSQLQNVPFDTVKIDKSFLVRTRSDTTDGAVVLRSIVNLSHELGRAVVVEGVESEEDARHLREIGCEYAQGFFFGESLSASEVPGYIAKIGQGDGAREVESGVARVSGES